MSSVTQGKAGIGVLLQLGGTASPTVYTTISGVTELQAGGVSLNMIDATHLDSPNYYQEFIPGLKSADEVTLTLQYSLDDTVHQQLRDILEDREIRKWKVDTTAIGATVSLTFSAYISQLGNVTIQPDQIMTQSVTLRPSGAYTTVTNS